MMVPTHNHAIVRFMAGCTLALRDPTPDFEVIPLPLTWTLGGLKYRFDSQYNPLNP